MTESSRADYVFRETILKLLSKDEISKVSTAEAATGLSEGEEYLDLENIDLGVQRARSVTKSTMGHVLPRSAVSDDTWNKVLALLAS